MDNYDQPNYAQPNYDQTSYDRPSYDQPIAPPSTAPIDFRTSGGGSQSTGVASKASRLQQAKERKFNSLTALAGLDPADLTDNFVEQDGYLDSLENKILNDYTPEELDYLINRLDMEYGAVQTEDGLMQRTPDGGLVPYEGDPANLASLYTFGTRDGNIKTGTWGGIDPRERYSDRTLRRYNKNTGQQQAVEEKPYLPVPKKAVYNPGGVVASGEGGKRNQFESRSDFIKTIIPYVEEASQALGVSPKAILAQAVLETGWGQSTLSDAQGNNSFNLFGIKADAGWKGESVRALTSEEVDGKRVSQKANFRSYSSLEEGIADYVNFLATNPRYSKILNSNLGADQYGYELQKAKYATDSNYGKSLNDIATTKTLNTILEELGRTDDTGYDSAVGGYGSAVESQGLGVDRDQLLNNRLLPHSHVVLAEGLIHGNKSWLNNRVVRQRADGRLEEYRQLRDMYGSGATEIYTPMELDETVEIDGDKLWAEFQTRFRPESRRQLTYDEQIALFDRQQKARQANITDNERTRNESAYNIVDGRFDFDRQVAAFEEQFRARGVGQDGLMDRLANAAAGAGAMAVLEAAINPADMVAEVFGFDLGTEEEKTAMANNLFGYKGQYAEAAMEEIKGNVTNLYNAYKNGESFDLADFYEILKTTIKNPELIGTSIGGIAALVLGFGKFTKYGKAIGDVEKSYRAGKISKEAAKAEVKNIKDTHTLLNKTATMAADNAGYALVVAGRTNDTINEFKSNIDRDMTAEDYLRIVAVEGIAAGLDKFSGSVILKDIPGVNSMLSPMFIQSTKDALKSVSDPLLYARLYAPAQRAIASGSRMVGAAAGEGVTEYIQTLLEIFNEKYATDKYGKDVAEILFNDESNIEALTGAAVGFTTGGQMDAMGKVARALRRRGKEGTDPEELATEQPSMTQDTMTIEEQTQARAAYIDITNRFLDRTSENSDYVYTTDQAGQLSEQIAYLKDISFVMETATAEEKARAATAITAMENKLLELIENSDDPIVLTRNTEPDLTRNDTITFTDEDGNTETVELDKTEEEEKPAQKPEYTASEKEKILITATELLVEKYKGEVPQESSEKLYNFAEVNKVPKDLVERLIKSYATVEIESTVEERGVIGRADKLRRTLDSGTATKEDVQKQYDEAVSFYATTEASIDALKKGIEKAENRARTENKKVWSGKKEITVKTEYMTHPESSSKGEAYNIILRKQGKKWVPDVRDAKKRIEAKTSTSKRLASLIDTFHTEAEQFLDPDTSLNIGGYVITKSSGKDSKGTEREISYVAQVGEALDGKKISKVILGEGRAGYWQPTSIRARTNSAVTNISTARNQEYSKDDVVYLHSIGTVKQSPKSKRTELYNKDSDANKEVDAAAEAGATIVLANDHRVGTHHGNRLAKYLETKGYIPLGTNTVEKNIFVPDTEANAQRLAKKQEQDVAAKEAKKEEEKAKNKLIRIAIERLAAPSNTSARPMEEIEADYSAALEAVRPYFSERALKQAIKELEAAATAEKDQETLDVTTDTTQLADDIDPESITDEAAEALTDKAIDEALLKITLTDNEDENIKSFVERAVRDTINEAKEAIRVAKQEGSPVKYANKSIRTLVEQSIADDVKAAERGTTLLEAWKVAKTQRLEGNSLLGALNEALKVFGLNAVLNRDKAEAGNIVLGGIGKTILETAVGAKNDLETFYVKVRSYDKNGVETITNRIAFSKKEQKIGGEFVHKGKGVKGTEVLAINRVIHNPNGYLQSTKTTPLNTLEVSILPKVFKDVAETTKATMKKLFIPLTAEEKDFKVPEGKETPGIFYTMDSPARTLIYDADGNIHESMALAMGVAIRSVISTEKRKLMIGPKDLALVAAMFGVQETNVTQAMIEFARDHGSFSKSIQDTLGKAVLQSLGISMKSSNKVNMNHYERLVIDLGNMALRVAESEGLLNVKEVKSNKLATLIKGGEVWVGEKAVATTSFVSISHDRVKDPETGITRNHPAKNPAKALSEYEDIDEFMPDVTSSLKEPFFGDPPSRDYQRRAVNSIRNDKVGGQVPKRAKKALKGFMNTPYQMNIEEVDKFLEMLDNPETHMSTLKLLGYIEISETNPEYVGLLYDQKIIQETINADIEKSIENVRKVREQIREGIVDNQMFFGFYYSTNHRYNVDSNTINPQGDKLHRFFFQPKAHKVTYRVDRSNNTFYYDYEKDGKKMEIDSSLYVRAALAQAMGVGIDKTYTEEIIKTGNALLALTPEQITEMEENYFRTGRIVFPLNGTLANMKPDHPSHALQAIRFLSNYKSDNSDTFTSSLSAEFDALTSGFSNKVQQFGTLDNLNSHANRVGLIRDTLDNAETSEVITDTKGINDMLADTTRLDSYKNLADLVIRKVGEILNTGISEGDLFNDIRAILPGGNLIGQTEFAIDGALRNLFKPPFMIFNYSASVDRIVKNLGQEMIEKVLSTIAETDLRDPENAEVLKAAEAIASKLPKTSALELQQKLRDEPLYLIKVQATSIDIQSGGKKTKPLVDYLAEELIEPTYGEAVKEAFNKEFEEFIEIQNVTNDMFKQSYAIFNQLLLEKIKAYRADENNDIITEEILKGMIDELRPVFPVIAGPLSDMLKDSAELSDGIHIYDTSTRSPNEIMNIAPSPQAKTRKADGTRASDTKANPLVRSIIAAANSGAVLPFHAIDGAQMAMTANLFADMWVRNSNIEGSRQMQEGDPDTLGSGLTTVHDAIIPPLPFSDIIGFLYNSNTAEINRSYSVMAEIQAMAVRAKKAISDKDSPFYLDTEKLEVSVPEGLSVLREKSVAEAKKENKKAIDEIKVEIAALEETDKNSEQLPILRSTLRNLKAEFSFKSVFNKTFIVLENLAESVEKAREAIYTKGTRIGTLVGMRGSVYTIGDGDTPDLSYLSEYTELYTAEAIPLTKEAEKELKRAKNTVNKAPTTYADRAVLASRVIGHAEGLSSLKEYHSFVKENENDTPYRQGEIVMVVSPAAAGPAKLVESLMQSDAAVINKSQEALAAGAILLFDTVDSMGSSDSNESRVFNHLISVGAGAPHIVNIDGVGYQLLSKQPVIITDVTTDRTVSQAEEDSGIITALDNTQDGTDNNAVADKINKLKEEGCTKS